MGSWEQYLVDNRARFLEEYFDFVRIPSISALPEHAVDVMRAAEWVANRLEAAGVENIEIMPTGGHPVVYGDWLHAGQDVPTIMIYGHFDVQPVDPLDQWETPPFEPTIKDNRVYARGASDDKGGMVAPIFATEALLSAHGKLPVNVKYCFEGQEEIGSPTLPGFFETHYDKFACDLILNSDGLMYSPDEPMLFTSLKGLCSLEITVKGPNSDLHSGLHGGVLQNPIEALAQLIATFRHADGTVAIEGFFDDVFDLADKDKELIAKVPFDEAEYKEQLGIPAFFGEPGYTTRERNWARPTLEINGIWGGFTGEGTKTVIPSTAHCKVTCRLVDQQDPVVIGNLFSKHVQKYLPVGVTATVEILPDRGIPFTIPADHPGQEIAAEVLAEMYGQDPYFVKVGGSIPISAHFDKELGVKMVNFGWILGDENLHAPNEFFRLESFDRGQRAYCMVLYAMSKYPTQ